MLASPTAGENSRSTLVRDAKSATTKQHQRSRQSCQAPRCCMLHLPMMFGTKPSARAVSESSVSPYLG